MNDNIITAKVKLHNYRFPKNKTPNSGEYAIVLFEVSEVSEGKIDEDAFTKYGESTIIVTGNMPKLDKGVEYILQAKYTKDPKWGPQYQCETIRMDYDMNKKEDQEKFFSYFISDHQIESLFEASDNPIEFLKNKDIESLTNIKGIGPVTASRMCIRYAENINNGRAYIELKDLGITKYAIDKLIKQFGSADVVVDIIKSNPYQLIKLVRGYGWEKADKIARSQGFSTGCKERCLAYAQYRLEKTADDGNSCMSIGELVEDVYQTCYPVQKDDLTNYLKESMAGQAEFNEILEKILNGEKDIQFPLFFYSSENKKVGLFYYRLLEKKILNELKRLVESKNKFVYEHDVCEKIIQEVEEEQGYKYTHEQRKAIWSILDQNVSVLTGLAGCVDCDTEYFNGSEWKKISQYQNGEKVLIYHEDGTSSLEVPLNYIKKPAESLWRVNTKYGIDMCVCDEHNTYYITSKGNLFNQPFKKIREMHEKSLNGFGGKFITSFTGSGKGIPLTDNEIKLMLAVICDGSFPRSNSSACKIRLKKDRKKQELRKICEEAGVPYIECPCSPEGFSVFSLKAPRHEKIFSSFWYDCSNQQLKLICDNILQWDGHVDGKRKQFSSNVKENADFVQYAFSACGYKAVILEDDRVGQVQISKSNKRYIRKSLEYTISITARNLISFGGFHKDNMNKTKIQEYKTLDGYKYCFTVSTHMWIMRRNGKIVITGNCGKSSTVKPLIKIFEHYGKEVAQCALSGRAASLLTEYTGLVGKTIHRLLGYIPEQERFAHDAKTPLKTDVIILDETSMVGEELFLSLISAIRSGSKLVMLGDVRQLPPLSVGNLLSDCIASGYIPTNALTIIHRQALQSGIISQSLQVCEGHSLVKNDFSGEELRGDLKDFKMVGYSDAMLVHSKAIDEFKFLMSKGINPDDIQIVVPVRSKGMNSCRFFNAEIQHLVNSEDKSKKSVTIDLFDNGQKFQVTYRPNDKVMIIKNNYHAKTIYGKEVAIFNGNIGHITDIDNESMIIDLDEQGKVILAKEEWSSIIHGWAATCHKLQGSQSPFAIICLDSSAYSLLMREWLYTAITRAKKYCALIGQPKALNAAVRNSNIKIKQTWLREDLKKEFLHSVGAAG